MKISHMLKREDFYNIIKKTLEIYYKDCDKTNKLYVYPQLNAIICKNASKSVRKYLYTEYNVKGSLLKRVVVKLFCWFSLHTFGLFSKKRLYVRCDANEDTLIYPCNRKIRLFDFSKHIVTVVQKYGFPDDDLQNEIRFRTTYSADFIPKLVSKSKNGYSEEIIDGYPLARDTKNQEKNTILAYALWRDYTKPYDRIVSTKEYCIKLKQQFDNSLQSLQNRMKKLPYDAIVVYWNDIINKIDLLPQTIVLTLSHGDLQPGNIWVKNGSEKIIIIDWESYAERSVSYDETVLFSGLRNLNGLAKYINNFEVVDSVVLAEDLLFRLHELLELPEQYGIDDFTQYLNIVSRR